MFKRINILFLIALLFCGCGLFGLRDVETPTESRSHFDPPVTADIVISNLTYAINEKDISNYLKCFIDTAYTTKRFVYTADVTSQIQYPIFQNWSLSYEKTYFNNLISSTGSNYSYLYLSNESWSNYSDSAVYDADYLLRFDHQKTNVSKALNGRLRFIIIIDSKNLWSISRWTDYKLTNTNTTWSILKANFSN